MNKIWNKPLHKRIKWKTQSIIQKCMSYIKLFGLHYLNIWMLPLPFPTFLKCIYTSVILTIMMVPLIYPMLIVLANFATIQSLSNALYPENCGFRGRGDLIGWANDIIKTMPAERYILAVKFKLRQYYLIGSTIISFIDYVRLIMSVF